MDAKHEAAVKADKEAKKMTDLMNTAVNAHTKAKADAKTAAGKATLAHEASTKSKAAAIAAHSKYSDFVKEGHANGFIH